MNVRPLWGYRPAHLMEMRMHALMENFIVKKKRFPTPVEVQSMLRSDKQLRKAIADLFHNKCLVEMHEVDYEIGIRHATSILNTPKVLENPQMVDMVERGIANAGQVIEAFYRGETQHV